MKTKIMQKILIALCSIFIIFSTSSVFAATKLTKPTIKSITSSSCTSLKITWNSVSGATGYQLYNSTDKKTWKKVKTTTSTSYTNKNLTTGKTYYYKVRAYTTSNNKNIYSSFSSIKYHQVVPATPKISSITTSYNTVTVKWSKVADTVGYRIYRSTDNKNWTTLKTTSSTSYIDSLLSYNTKYYYKVKAYVINDNSKLFSGSSTKSISTLPAYKYFSSTEDFLNDYFDAANIVSVVSPSGFSGASSQKAILLSDGSLYVSSGLIENEDDVQITKVATGVSSIKYISSGTNEGAISVKKSSKFTLITSKYSWLIFK